MRKTPINTKDYTEYNDSQYDDMKRMLDITRLFNPTTTFLSEQNQFDIDIDKDIDVGKEREKEKTKQYTISSGKFMPKENLI